MEEARSSIGSRGGVLPVGAGGEEFLRVEEERSFIGARGKEFSGGGGGG